MAVGLAIATTRRFPLAPFSLAWITVVGVCCELKALVAYAIPPVIARSAAIATTSRI
jgi:hypothetical protein